MDTESYDYQKAVRHFWATAATNKLYRGNYGGLFSAMICMAETYEVDCLNQNYAFWQQKTRIGKEEYYAALSWLQEYGYLEYEGGVGQVKCRITLKLTKIFSVGSHTNRATNSRPIGLPIADRDAENLPLVCGRKDIRSHGHAPLDVVIDLKENSSSCSSGIEYEETLDNDNNSILSLEEEQSIEDQITAMVNAKIPPVLRESQQESPLSELPVLEFIKVSGREVSRRGAEDYIHRTHTGRSGDEWKKKHPKLDFEETLSAFLDSIEQEHFNKSSYLKRRFGYFSDDLQLGTRTLGISTSGTKQETAMEFMMRTRSA